MRLRCRGRRSTGRGRSRCAGAGCVDDAWATAAPARAANRPPPPLTGHRRLVPLGRETPHFAARLASASRATSVRISLDDEVAGADLDLLHVDHEDDLAGEEIAVRDARRAMEADPVRQRRLRIFRRLNRRNEVARLARGMRELFRFTRRWSAEQLIGFGGPEVRHVHDLVAGNVRLGLGIVGGHDAAHLPRGHSRRCRLLYGGFRVRQPAEQTGRERGAARRRVAEQGSTIDCRRGVVCGIVPMSHV